MSVVAPVLDRSDPKQDRLYPFHLPNSPEWEEKKDFFSQSAMMGAGAGMFIKNPMFVWGSMIMAVIGYVNQQPLRAPKDASSPLLTLGMAVAGVVATNMPKLMLAPEARSQVPPVA
ncbi:hypothetical protein JCM24511_01760 [Saitozyma sp. JCM 24511]|uniref:Uncharacterized protein n=1 Tax=Saitozyma podzolica TaxID=1890683 RepID=A0A427Y8M7_9TREE|nr:hypothetical protein EHS25_003376 [Saitozyma podzolica]GFZ44039.1 hypothetical protein JCM24511_01760 [Saitozyma sp. JCM 24511]